ncbi:unnamed protein product, partial [Mesorhabditis belari]|uniref:Uncharacterized protein n=1 Tax=Mesorhabditis belari TaxID=2138241 RepID=A0AAF3J827_9BILA
MLIEKPIREQFLGVFRLIIKCLGLDLTYSIFNIRQAKENGEMSRAIFYTITTTIIMTILIMENVVIEHQSFSILWLLTNVKFGMVLHGTASVGFLAGMTTRRAFSGVEKRLDALTDRSPPKPIAKMIVIIVALILSTLLMYIVCSHCADDIRKWEKAQSPRDFLNFWGADPFLRIIAAAFSCFSTTIYVLSWGPVLTNLTHFNQEMRKTINTSEKEMTYETLVHISNRQKELLTFVRFMNNTFGRYVNIGFLGALITHVDALGIVIGQRKWLTGSEVALFTGYMFISALLVGCLLIPPATASYRMLELSKRLLLNTSIVGSRNEKHLPLINHIIQRAESKENKLSLAMAFRIDENFPHRINFFMLGLGYALVVLGKIYGVQE